MLVALIADIHGNAHGLDAVLADLSKNKADLLVCLGDVAATGPEPLRSLRQIRELGCPVIMGNNDDWLVNPVLDPGVVGEDKMVAEIDRWCAQQLSAEDRAFLKTFEPTLEFSLPGGRSLLCVHGSPRSYSESLGSRKSEEELAEALAGVSADIVACGHTHEPMIRRFRKTLIVNPGSVGQPTEHPAGGEEPVRNPPWAEYALLEASSDSLQIELRRVHYDVRPLLEVACSSGMPHAEWWVGQWG
jgi:putative phosphoesterase